jgi:hypothetical protein
MEMVDYLQMLGTILCNYQAAVRDEPDETNLHRVKRTVSGGITIEEDARRILSSLPSSSPEAARLSSALAKFVSELKTAQILLLPFLDPDRSIEVPATDPSDAASAWAAQQVEQNQIGQQRWVAKQDEQQQAQQKSKPLQPSCIAAIGPERILKEQEAFNKVLVKPASTSEGTEPDQMPGVASTAAACAPMGGEDSATAASTCAPTGGAQLASQPLPESQSPSSEHAKTQKIQRAQLEQSILELEEKGQAIKTELVRVEQEIVQIKAELAELRRDKSQGGPELSSVDEDVRISSDEKSKELGSSFCQLCQTKEHLLACCPKFKAMLVDDRLQFCRLKRIHFACLLKHPASKCRIPENQRQCEREPTCPHRHHALLHGGKLSPSTRQPVKKEGQLKQFHCLLCNRAGHSLSYCPRFKRMPLDNRLEFCVQRHLHFRCLARHPAGKCRIPATLQCCPKDAACRHVHHKLLHGARFPWKKKPIATRQADPEKSGSHSTLKLVKVLVRSNESSSRPAVEVEALINCRQSSSLIDQDLFQDLSSHEVPASAPKPDGAAFQISPDGLDWYPVTNASLVSGFKLQGKAPKWDEFLMKNPKFQAVELPGDLTRAKVVGLMLGLDVQNLWMPTEAPKKWLLGKQLHAYQTKLGWVCGGPILGMTRISC